LRHPRGRYVPDRDMRPASHRRDGTAFTPCHIDSTRERSFGPALPCPQMTCRGTCTPTSRTRAPLKSGRCEAPDSRVMVPPLASSLSSRRDQSTRIPQDRSTSAKGLELSNPIPLRSILQLAARAGQEVPDLSRRYNCSSMERSVFRLITDLVRCRTEVSRTPLGCRTDRGRGGTRSAA
jgi:hypothetical protein